MTGPPGHCGEMGGCSGVWKDQLPHSQLGGWWRRSLLGPAGFVADAAAGICAEDN